MGRGSGYVALMGGLAGGAEVVLLPEFPVTLERIAELAREGLLEGITDLRDESDRQGMRIVIELSKNADAEKVLKQLYRRTPMQSTFSMIMLALVDGEPRLLNLKQALRVYLEHRIDVVRRRSRYELDRAKKRAHILEGLRVALINLDEVISLIRRAQDAEQARQRLIKRFKLSQIQAEAILDTPLRRLASLERKKIELEYKETVSRIRELESLLAPDTKIRTLISEELTQISSAYGDIRRTHIVGSKADGKPTAMPLTATDVATTKDTWVVISQEGLISRTPTARLPRLSGRTPPKLVIGAKGRDTLYLFEREGNAVAFAVHTIPESDDPSHGAPLSSVSAFASQADLVAGIAIAPDQADEVMETHYLLFATESGMVKKSPLSAFPGPIAKVFQGVKVNEGDALGWVRLTNGEDELVLASRNGYAIRFHESDVRPMGLVATGVLGMKFDDPHDQVVGMDLIRSRSDLFQLSEDGLAKRTALRQYPCQGRYGKGVLTWKSGVDVSLIGATIGKSNDRLMVHLEKRASRSIRIGDASRKNRALSGEMLIPLKAGDRVIRLMPVFCRQEVASKEDDQSAKTSESKDKKTSKSKRRKATSAKSPSASKASKSKSSSRSKKASVGSKTSSNGAARKGKGK